MMTKEDQNELVRRSIEATDLKCLLAVQMLETKMVKGFADANEKLAKALAKAKDDVDNDFKECRKHQEGKKRWGISTLIAIISVAIAAAALAFSVAKNPAPERTDHVGRTQNRDEDRSSKEGQANHGGGSQRIYSQ